MNVQIKSAVLEYLSNLVDIKNRESRDPRRWLSRTSEYCKYLLAGDKAIDFSIDMKNSSNELIELESHIQAVIEKSEGDISLVDECLNHFQVFKGRYSAGQEYCINILKDVKIRLIIKNSHQKFE
jgi:hypothetical protein